MRDRASVFRLLERERPDALVHLAFVVNPMHDEQAMYEIDVGGTQNVLEAASTAGTGQLLVTSSATAYGAFPDNPVPLTEDHPVRGVSDFEYARDKAEADRLCQLWACRHPDRVMTIVRPCIVFGPTATTTSRALSRRSPSWRTSVTAKSISSSSTRTTWSLLLWACLKVAMAVSSMWPRMNRCRSGNAPSKSACDAFASLTAPIERLPRRCGACGASRRHRAT